MTRPAPAPSSAARGAGFSPTVIMDPLGGGFPAAAVALIEPLGRYVVYGTSAGAQVTLDWQQVYRKGVTVIGQGNVLLTTTERTALLTGALGAAAAGELTMPVDREVPLDSVNDALALLADRAVTGKVLLNLR